MLTNDEVYTLIKFLENRIQELLSIRKSQGNKSKICTLKDINLTKSGSRVLDVSGSNEVETTETTLLSRSLLVKPNIFINTITEGKFGFGIHKADVRKLVGDLKDLVREPLTKNL
jgi:hypothetical protein